MSRILSTRGRVCGEGKDTHGEGDMHRNGGGVYMAGGVHGTGCTWQWVMHGRGACVVEGMSGRRDGYCSGRYASYWNTFLLQVRNG